MFTPASISRPLSIFQQVGNKSSRRRWPCRTRGQRLQHRPKALAGSGPTRTGASGTSDCETLSRTGLVANRSSRTPKCAVGLIRIVISKRDPELLSPYFLHGRGIRTAPLYADFHFVPAALQNKKYTGYYHIKNTIGRTT